jgi:hypothetical protein
MAFGERKQKMWRSHEWVRGETGRGSMHGVGPSIPFDVE